MILAMTRRRRWFGFFAIVLCFLFFAVGCTRFSKQKPGEKPDLSQPRQSFYSAPLERLNSGFTNILTGPFELINQPRIEIKSSDPIRGFIPGLFKGVTWFAIREIVGAFEIGTFIIPWKPHLKPFDIDWLAI